MVTELEKKIRELEKELAELKKDQSVLRLQPCRGDSEIRKKDAKFDEVDSRAKTKIEPSATWKGNARY